MSIVSLRAALLAAHLFAACSAQLVAPGSEWSYEGSNGPETWSKNFPQCGGKEQSPIDMPSSCAVRTYANFSGSLVSNVPTVVNMTLENSGHTVTLTPPSNVTVSGGGLNGTYNLAAVHFHWGNASSRGSEHTVRGRTYPMEMHVVTHKSGFADLHAALISNDREAVAVLGIFVEVKNSSTTSSAINALVGALPNVSKAGNTSTVTLPLTDLTGTFGAILTSSPFFRYLGSLTTPNCDQEVIWTVFRDTLAFTENQLNTFRQLSTVAGAPMVDNFRPIQQLNNRTVYCSSSVLDQSPPRAAAVALRPAFGGYLSTATAAATVSALMQMALRLFVSSA